MVHEFLQVIPKGSYCTLQTIKRTDYYVLPSITFTELTSQDCPYLLCARHQDLVLLNFCYLHWKVIQGSQSQINTERLPQHYTCMGYGVWRLCHVSSLYQPSLALEIFHLNIKNHTTIYPLVKRFHNFHSPQALGPRGPIQQP